MDADKLDRLAAAGFVVGSVQELLGLSDPEMRDIEARLNREHPEMSLTLIKDLYGPSGAPKGAEVDTRVRQKASWADRNDPEYETDEGEFLEQLATSRPVRHESTPERRPGRHELPEDDKGFEEEYRGTITRETPTARHERVRALPGSGGQIVDAATRELIKRVVDDSKDILNVLAEMPPRMLPVRIEGDFPVEVGPHDVKEGDLE